MKSLKIYIRKFLQRLLFESLGEDGSAERYKGATLLQRYRLEEPSKLEYTLISQNDLNIWSRIELNRNYQCTNIVSVWSFDSRSFTLNNGYLYRYTKVFYAAHCFTLSMAWRSLAGRKKIYQGTVLYLSNTNQRHYGHVIFYVLPMLLIARRYIDVTHVYAGAFSEQSFYIEFMQHLAPNITILATPTVADRILYVNIDKKTLPDGRRGVAPSLLRMIKSELKDVGSKSSGLGNQIFIRRGNVKYRKLINEKEIVDYLEARGFKSVAMDGLSIHQQAAIFREAKVIVGVHGGAMANLIYSQAATVIELLGFGCHDETTMELCSVSECNYTRLEGEKIDLHIQQEVLRDIRIPIPVLQAALEDIN